MVVSGELVRLYNKTLLELLQIGKLPAKKVTVWAKQLRVIPPNHACFVDVFLDAEAKEESVFIENLIVQKPNYEFSISECLTADNGKLLVTNNSKNDILIKSNQRLARGLICNLDESIDVNVSKIDLQNLTPFVETDILSQVDKLEEQEFAQLLELLNKFRACFSDDLSELGEINNTEININLKDNNKTVSYKPYRLSWNEREVVRKIVDELIENNIIQESSSEFASPIILVKKNQANIECVLIIGHLIKIQLKKYFQCHELMMKLTD